MEQDLSLLRQSLRQQRQALTSSQQAQHAQQALVHAQNFWPFLEAMTSAISFQDQGCKTKKTLLGFISSDGELQTSNLLDWVAQKTDWQIALPVLGEQFGTMTAVLWNGQGPLVCNRLGILEPPKTQPSLEVKEISCVLMPLVAFDHLGNRVGMGGGYYDRLLAECADKTIGQRPWLLGWGHGFQQVNALKPQSWDIGLDACITEQACVRFTEI